MLNTYVIRGSASKFIKMQLDIYRTMSNFTKVQFNNLLYKICTRHYDSIVSKGWNSGTIPPAPLSAKDHGTLYMFMKNLQLKMFLFYQLKGNK